MSPKTVLYGMAACIAISLSVMGRPPAERSCKSSIAFATDWTVFLSGMAAPPFYLFYAAVLPRVKIIRLYRLFFRQCRTARLIVRARFDKINMIFIRE